MYIRDYFRTKLPLSALLHETKMTQKELGKRMGVSQSVISEQCRGNVTVRWLEKAAFAAGKRLIIVFEDLVPKTKKIWITSSANTVMHRCP